MKNIRVALILISLFVNGVGCKKKCVDEIPNCQLAPDSGPCLAGFTKYYYDQNEKRCREFTYGGCEGVIPFHTLEECKACECNK